MSVKGVQVLNDRDLGVEKSFSNLGLNSISGFRVIGIGIGS